MLLPEPGAPLSKHICPATRPPPRTRSNSPIPVVMRGTGPDFDTVVTGRAGRRGVVPARLLFMPGVAAAGVCRSIVPKAPHFGHLPAHRMVVASHAVQRYELDTLAMEGPYRAGQTFY
ncbi:unannotated protein [freshwater metagenome]|uniref:Unannotated protein n=1 Tax=freshwater metagenome TaxID=449393 RepID=A0A6J6HN59_9ZZZZ